MNTPSPPGSDVASSPRQFEEALARLEAIVRQLDREELPLEESLRLFQEGMRLYRYCSHSLEQARQMVDALQAGEDEPRPWTPLSSESDGEHHERID